MKQIETSTARARHCRRENDPHARLAKFTFTFTVTAAAAFFLGIARVGCRLRFLFSDGRVSGSHQIVDSDGIHCPAFVVH